MASYRVGVPEPHANGNVHFETWVIVQVDDGEGGTVPKEIDHFTVVIRAVDVTAVSGLTLANRIARYKELFYADTRISGIILSESAVAQMLADVNFPVTIPL